MGIFGWSLPPGCTTLPGEEAEQHDNRYFAEAFPDADSPAELYRQLYKYTACGPYLSVRIQYWDDPTHSEGNPQLVEKTIHCDGLRALGTWADMDKAGKLAVCFYVGSIIEGVDYDTDLHEVRPIQEEEEPEVFRDRLDTAVTEVNDEANSIWNQTHGCDTCNAHWVAEGCGDGTIDGATPVWSECPDCDGEGICI